MRVLVVPSFCCECSYSTDLSPKWLDLYSKVQAGKSFLVAQGAQEAPKAYPWCQLQISLLYRLRPNPTGATVSMSGKRL